MFRKIGNKYNNRKTVVDGIKFDSIRESKRYIALSIMQKMGKISSLELQTPYTLLKSFKDHTGKTQRAIKYIPDFRYIIENRIIVEDVKGLKTEVYKIKKKLFLKQNPNIFFIET